MQNKFAMHCFVAGIVQGVWYRANTQKQAQQLGLTGWVRNLPDSRVEVLACGDKTAVLKLFDWLKVGPPKAKVTEVTFEEVNWQNHDEFTII